MNKKSQRNNSEIEEKQLANLKGQSLGVGIVSLAVFALTMWLIIFHKDFLNRFSSFGYLGLFISNFLGSATIFIPLPTLISSFIGGEVLNPLIVGMVAGFGSASGDFLGYLLGYGARNVVGRIFHKDTFLGRFEPWIRKNGVFAVFVLSFIPNPLFDGVGLIAGALELRPRDFFLATLAGRVLRNILLAISGQKFL